jgi:hypothetical protein
MTRLASSGPVATTDASPGASFAILVVGVCCGTTPHTVRVGVSAALVSVHNMIAHSLSLVRNLDCQLSGAR